MHFYSSESGSLASKAGYCLLESSKGGSLFCFSLRGGRAIFIPTLKALQVMFFMSQTVKSQDTPNKQNLLLQIERLQYPI